MYRGAEKYLKRNLGKYPWLKLKHPGRLTCFSLIGSIIILISAIAEFIFTSIFSLIPFIGLLGIPFVVLSIIGLIVGVLSVALSIRLGSTVSEGEAHVIGALLLILAIVSFFTAILGGFIVGFLLLLVGSILSLTWRP
ncbi:MAG: DUF6114 domain-containing protein [Caldivirga sp.]